MKGNFCIAWVLSLLLSISLYSSMSYENLRISDIKKVMNKILDLHLNKKAISPTIVKRSFSLFISRFDPNKIYLLRGEVEPYLNPSPQLIQRTLTDYNNNRFNIYYRLHKLFQKAILRSHAYRQEFKEKAADLFAHPLPLQNLAKQDEELFSSNITELKKNYLEYMQVFINNEIGLIQHITPAKENKIINLFLKKMHEREIIYLGLDNQGRKLPKVKEENFMVIEIAKALAGSLDSHTDFYSPEEAYDMKIRLQKGFSGLGIVLQESIDGIIITKILDNSPAQRSGRLQANDRIIQVDGQALENLSFKRVLQLIRGKKGSKIILSVKREKKDLKYFEVELRREEVVINDNRVESYYERFGQGVIGTITLHSFYEGKNGISSVNDVKKAIAALKQKGNLKGLILDLRNNSGGFLLQSVKVAGLFISNGVIVISKYSDGQKHFFRDVDGKDYLNGPLVILTSKLSASAAEIVAQTLQDYGAAIVVGDERTYGKGSIQHQTVIGGKVPDLFKVTVGRYYTVSGKSTQIDGVKSDILVPSVYSRFPLGEKYLQYPLQGGKVSSAFNDNLLDVEVTVKPWFRKYYLPFLERPDPTWRRMVLVLRKNSQERIKNDKNFQAFLKRLDKISTVDGVSSQEELEDLSKSYGLKDLQMQEALNIIKDMLYLKKSTFSPSPTKIAQKTF